MKKQLLLVLLALIVIGNSLFTPEQDSGPIVDQQSRVTNSVDTCINSNGSIILVNNETNPLYNFQVAEARAVQF